MNLIAFIINGDERSAMGERARSLAVHLRERYDVRLQYREGNKLAALFRFHRFLRRVKPRVAYVFDMSYSGVLGAWLYKLTSGNRLVIETGDVIYELMRSTGNRGLVGLWMTRWLENFSLRIADRIVVRGRFHQEVLARMGVAADVIQDGVDTKEFTPLNVDDLRRQHKLEGVLTVGLVGSSVWSEKLGMCYGWELIEMLRLLPEADVKGIIIGSGTGIAHLKERCREYGIEDRVLFVGHVPYEELPRYLNLIDVCLSTQTNNLVGQVRTSGKLPLYLAAGRYVLASDVGEAARVLEPEMLIPYDGVKDEQYPRKLAQRVRAILNEPQKLDCAERQVAVARKFFEYSKLAQRLGDLFDAMLARDENSETTIVQQKSVLDSTVVSASEKLD